MKTNSWIKLCLIVLSLAMAISMFACGNKEENTTAAPETPTTEAPTKAPTEAPTTEPTEAPTTETTEAPTTEPTEAPTTETTEAPTTEPTEAPTTETTEVPTTETTEAPTTETTEPAVEGDFLEFWDKEALLYDIPAGNYFVEETENGIKFENTFNADAPLVFFQNRPEDEMPTGKYLFMKYRAPAQEVYIQLFTATDKAAPDGGRTTKIDASKGLINDEEWHILVVDISKYITSVAPAEDGQYYLRHFRMDIEGSEFTYLEIAYMGLTDEISDIADYVKATEEDAAALCNHPVECAVGAYVDEYSHTTICSLCETAAEASAHSTAGKATWNEETGRYETTCTVCEGVAAVDWQWSRDYSTYSEGHRFACTGGGTSHSVQNGVLVITPNGNTTWGGLSVGVDGAGALGQYYFVKYRVIEAANDAETVKTIIRFNNKTADVNMIADGDWHVAFINLADMEIEASDGLIESTGDHWFLTYSDVNLIKYEVAFEGCVDSLDRVPEGFEPGTPDEETTEAPGGETTEAPATETTEAPATETTEAPATETTETPATETTETPEEETTEQVGFIVFEADDLAGVSPSVLEKEVTDGGVKFTNPTGNDANFTLFKGVTGVESGNILFFKYRANATTFEVFTSTTSAGPTGGQSAKYPLNVDGEWHVMVVTVGHLTAAADGKYYVQHLRVDIEGFEGAWAEFAYIGYANDASLVAEYVKAHESADTIQAVCPHSTELMEGACIDAYTHAPVCTLCGLAGEASAHVTGVKATWNEETGRYEATCTVCGGVAAKDWQWSRDYSDFDDGHKFASTGGGNSHSVQNGILVMTPDGNTAWGGVSVGTDGAGALGQYYAFKYRVVEVANDADVANIIIRFNGQIATLDLIADGEWHVQIVDLADLGITPVDGAIESTGDHWFLNYADANLIKYEVAFEGCVESLDRLPEGFKPAE